MRLRRNLHRLLLMIVSWFDAYAGEAQLMLSPPKKILWLRVLPFVGMHLACFSVFWVGYSHAALVAAIVLYVVRMFAITGFYHRYFSHRTFKTSRVCQFIFALLGSSAVQRGPLWWAAHHRNHHACSDREGDVHSPRQNGFFWSHMGWFLAARNAVMDRSRIKDWLRFPELKFIDRFDTLVPILLACGLYKLGDWLQEAVPEWGTSGPQMLVWGFVLSTVVLYHATFSINSMAHRLGFRRYATEDDSKNNFLLALLTLGEGWHNNHHYYPSAARQGFRWWEVDITYYLLKLMSFLGLVWDLRPVPKKFWSSKMRSKELG